jgi:1,4-dihydroxy-2-naphthoate octaprenyltransferase
VAVVVVLFAIPIAAAPVRTGFSTAAAPPLVSALKRMAIAELAYALLFSLGLLL